MKKLLLVLTVLLSGCILGEDVPVAPKWPDVPADLKISCPDLQKVDPETTKFSEVIDKVVDNYYTYHECQVKVDAWIEWYNNQKDIHEVLKK